MSYDGPDAPQFHRDLLAALKRWHKAGLGEAALASRLPSIERRLAGDPDLIAAAALRQVLRMGLDRLRFTGLSHHASLLEERFVHGRTIVQLCEEYSASERTFHYMQEEAIDALGRVLWTLEFGDPDVDRSHPRRKSRRTGSGRPRPEVQGTLLASPATTPAAPDTAPPQVLAPIAAPPLPSPNLPARSYSRLFGVEGVLAQLEERLADSQDHWLISVEGLGGLGKTAVAREAAGRMAATGRFAGIAWVTAKHEFYTWRGLERSDLPALTFEQLLDSIADQLENSRAPILVGRAKQDRARSLLESRPYLVVIDNLEAVRECESLPDQLWPLANPTKFLLTSRHQVGPCTSGWVTVSSLSLNRLSERDAAALLRYEAQLRGLHGIATATDEALRQVLDATGGHPLAIKLAVGQLMSLPMTRVLAILEPGSNSADPFYEYLYRPSWGLLSPAARGVVLMLALLPHSGAGWDDLAALVGLPAAELDGALRELVARSLVIAGEAQDRIYTLHPLTRRFVSSQPGQAAALQARSRRLGEYYAAYARRHIDNWPMLSRRLEHILQAIELCATSSPAEQRIAIVCVRLLGRFMQSRGNLTTWLSYLDLALQAAGELGDEAAQAELWNQKGMLIGREGDLNPVLALHRRAAEVFDRLQDRLNQARTLRLLGNVYYTRAERGQAMACYEQARHILEGLPAPEPREMSLIYNNMACVHGENRDWPRALAYYERAEALLDPERDQAALANLLDNIGELSWEMGCWQQAVTALERALPIQKATGDVVGEARTHHYLCLSYAGLEDWDRARSHSRQALSLYALLDTALGRAHLYTDLAAMYAEQGEIQTARSFLEVAEPLWRQAGSADGISRVRVVEGDLFVLEGEWSRADAAYQEVLLMLEDRIDLQPRRFTCVIGLAAARLGVSDCAGAAALLPQAQAVASVSNRPDLQVRALWLKATLDGAKGRPALEAALSLCAEHDGGNDRLNQLGRQTQARLNEWDSRYG